MTWRSPIIFSVIMAMAPIPSANASAVTGAVEITNSRDPFVRKNKDYSGVVIWLEPADRTPPPQPVPKRVRMIQRDRHFTPHVLAISVGSTVDFPNLDPIYHNAFSNFSGQPFDIGLYAPGTSKSEVFKQPGIVRVFCNIHPTMSAIIAVLATPWYAATDPTGRFTLPNVPAGEYQLRLFYERALPENLRFLERRLTVPDAGLVLPLISISETGYIPAPHLNKYGKPYPRLPNDGTYPGAQK
jgi:plastocyanin